MRALSWLGSGPEVWAMRIERVPEATETPAHELARLERAIAVVRTSKNGVYRTEALARLERRAQKLRCFT